MCHAQLAERILHLGVCSQGSVALLQEVPESIGAARIACRSNTSGLKNISATGFQMFIDIFLRVIPIHYKIHMFFRPISPKSNN